MKLLVIDDEPLTLEFLSNALREQGYSVDTSLDGEDGLFKALNWNYDAIILDVMLPGISGWDILSKLRQTKKTPVLMLTGKNTTEDQIRGLDIGADDYVSKPFDLDQLKARLRALIRRAYQHAHSKLEIRNVELDLTAHLLIMDGAPVELSAKEYAIVEYLGLRKDEIVTRSELYESIFEENDDPMSNVIDVHIGRIRKKLGRDFITTKHGKGYVLESSPQTEA